ncbi:sugar kinase [Streptomyces olindensis]|nr:sugar kinase [Streptomyces olindensis]
MSAAHAVPQAVTDVLTFGETMLSLQVDASLSVGASARTTVAGAETNVAIGLARLGHTASWAGRLGADEPARLVLRTLRAEGVHTQYATTDTTAPTGALLREQVIGDIARVHYWRAGSAASRQLPEHLGQALAQGARVLHVTGITCALGAGPLATVTAAVDYARAHDWTVVFDVNYRARLWSRDEASRALRKLRDNIDVVIASDDELPLLADDHADGDEDAWVQELLAIGAREVIIKRGGEGASRFGVEGDSVHQPAVRVPVVDTVGAGDAFCAGYISGLLDGLDPADRLQRAVTVGGFAVATHGDWEGLPHRDELALLDAAPGSTIR